MNKLWKKLKVRHSGKNKVKSLVISVVILLEIFALCTVGVYAWVETVSSIKITNETGTTGAVINDIRYTDIMIGDKSGTIDLLDYFEPSGGMHLAPASSADGKTFFFPKANISSNFIYRKGNVSDKNTTYLSVSFRLRADTNADFFFVNEQEKPISVDDNIRVSVTAYSEGENPEGHYDPATGKLISNTKIYANNASTTAVVNSTSGTTGATAVEKFSDHVKGKSSTARLFSVGANETKIVTINVWLQKKTADNTDITDNMAATQAINYLGITSDLTPRHVTLLPTPEWDRSGETQYFYAWCWDSSKGDPDKLYKLELDENEHYSFDYNGTYQSTLFIRAKRNDLTTENMANQWNTTYIHNKTEDTTIPDDPVDPTYIIKTINGGAYDNDTGSNKSTGEFQDPATIKVAACTNQSTWGTVTATSYIGTTISTHVIESTNSNSQKHKDTVHAWPEKAINLTATVANTNYAFVGWYDNPEGEDNGDDKNLLYTGATYTTTAPATPTEKTYYAKFKEVRKLTIYRYLDGVNSGTACGTITIAGTNSSSGSSVSKTVDKGTEVPYSADARTGYTLEGIYTNASGGTDVTSSSPITLDTDTTYYARYTTNTHTVYIDAIGSSGSTVQYGNETASTSVTKTDVKYNSSVTIKANPATGYKFVGWYTNSSGTGTAASTNASYTFTLGDADVHYYAKFEAKNSYYLKASWNGWSESQDHLTGSGNELTFTQELDPGAYEFKIYDGVDAIHWSNAYTYKYKYSNSTDTFLGGSGGDTLNSNNSTGNMKLNVGYTCKFTFHFNRTTNKFWITATEVTTYHVVGEITGGWDYGNNNKMTRVGNTTEYTYSVDVNGTKSFKILTNSGTWYSNGFGYHDGYYGASGGDTFNSSSGNCTMNGSNKTYIFHFDSSSKKFWITDP